MNTRILAWCRVRNALLVTTCRWASCQSMQWARVYALPAPATVLQVLSGVDGLPCDGVGEPEAAWRNVTFRSRGPGIKAEMPASRAFRSSSERRPWSSSTFDPRFGGLKHHLRLGVLRRCWRWAGAVVSSLEHPESSTILRVV